MKKPAAKPEAKKVPLFAPNNQKSNLLLDQNSDLRINSSVASQGLDDTTKDVLAAVAQSAQSLSESEASTLETEKLDKLSSDIESKDEDLSVPKWPKYTDPAS